MNKQFVLRYATLIIVMLWLQTSSHGQTGSNSTEDASPFETRPGCVLPCWNGYVPGQTTVQEVDGSILQLEQIQTTFSFQRSYNSENGLTNYLWIPPSPRSIANSLIRAQSGVVDHIRVALDHPYTLGDVYGLYGEPRVVNWQNYIQVLTLTLYYPAVGLVFEVEVPNVLITEADSFAFNPEWEGYTVWITLPDLSFTDQFYAPSGAPDEADSLGHWDLIEVLGYCNPPTPGDRFGNLYPLDDYSPIVNVARRAIIQAQIRTCSVD